MELKPSSYHFKQSFDNSPKSIGFIAQDVETIFPYLVDEFTTDGITYKSLTYDNFSVLAIAAIQEQQKIIEEQQDILEQLKTVICPDHPELSACQ